MSPNFQKKSLQGLIKTFVIAVPAFLIILSFIDLFIYYSFFDINIFSFISASTIISYSIQSIGIVILISLLSYLMLILLHVFSYLHNSFIRWFPKKFPEIIKNKIKRFIFAFIYMVIAMTIGLIIIESFGYVASWLSVKYHISEMFFLIAGLITLIFPILYLFWGNEEPIPREKYYMPIPFIYNLKVVVSIILISSFTLTIIKSTLDVYYFKKDIYYQFISGNELKGNYETGKIKLIGTTGDYYFLEHPKKEGILIKQFSDFKEVHLRTFRDTSKVNNLEKTGEVLELLF